MALGNEGIWLSQRFLAIFFGSFQVCLQNLTSFKKVVEAPNLDCPVQFNLKSSKLKIDLFNLSSFISNSKRIRI